VREADQPIEQRLRERIIDGKKAGMDVLLQEALTTYSALEIINRFLLDGMREVGELFGSGRMQLPFVLRSAETMKAAVTYLEPHMERVQGGQSKGVMVLATVKGDVHDIGKNLVDIILTNNGYRVVNLGIKVSIDQMLEVAEAEKADAIGMSGLLVKSTVVMKENLEIMRDRAHTIPVICGGAALNRVYVDGMLQDTYSTGDVYYSPDAFTGLHLMEELCGHQKERRLTGPGRKRHRRNLGEKAGVTVAAPTTEYAPSDVKPVAHVPTPPFWGSRIVQSSELSLRAIFSHINKRALFRGQWQYRRGRRDEAEYAQFLSEVVEPQFQRWCERAIERQVLLPAVAYGYFPCNADKNDLIVYRPEKGADSTEEWLRISFPRQSDGRRRCIADFFRSVETGERDVLGVQIVTMGARASLHADELFRADQYDDYLHFHGLAVESAEGLAELWHRQMRGDLQIAAGDAKTIDQLFQQGYQGSRYSFGYPACPNLEDQRHLFALLEPERIGLSLTEEYELVPEQSTSALIVHHPEAKYFNV
jgi:5-methyltetrahydrofolate--homocysteine methyltransferase